MSDDPRVVDHETARTLETPQGEDVIVLARGDEPGEEHDLLEFTIPREPGVPLHVHHDNDEAFYVLEGELTIQIADDRHRLTPGSYAFGPRGVPHGYRNTGDGPARVLVTYMPGNFVRFIKEVEELGSIDLDDDSDMERLASIFESYGLEMLGPPIEA